MTEEKTVIEGNNLIAEFMGYKVRETGDTTSDKRFGGGAWFLYIKDGVTSDSVFYDSSWDWMMKVFRKINDTLFDVEVERQRRFEFTIGSNWAKIKTQSGYTVSYKKDIDSDLLNTVFYVVVFFIKKYNKEKNEQ